MKSLIALSAIALSLSVKAVNVTNNPANPATGYPTPCITNMCIEMINYDSYVSYNGGPETNELCGVSYCSNQGCWGNGGNIIIGMRDCPNEDTPVGYVCYTCDENPDINCAGAGACAIGGATLITMPCGCDKIGISIYSYFGCCTLTYCIQYLHPCSASPDFWLQDEFWITPQISTDVSL